MTPENSFTPPLAFLVTAAGSGKRMGGGVKKEFRKIGNRSVLETTVLSMIEASVFSYGLITCPFGQINQTQQILSSLTGKLNKHKIKIEFCHGGGERQESVFLGLKHIEENLPSMLERGIILIHDGARPWASPALIRKVAEGSITHRACAPVTPSIDAMKQISNDGIITAHLPRKETVGVQTPQGFIFSDILRAHQSASRDGRRYIDDTEIFSRYIGDVHTIAGESANKKITFAEDINAAKLEISR
ncbi:MAG: 2-C-methyl-D-erythritol 4-phosphate cytidylyltransferase [Spirochaetales bacterium]|nr:2-C-methyl-D-erythritol 4-phosphate cytidylyltransferase [Spirochaetales bacterium]